MNKHEFQLLAKSFRAGRVSLEQFTRDVFATRSQTSNSEREQRPFPKLPTREANSHKGDYGRLLVIGGSRGMAGAIGLTGLAALRSGAGLVKVAVPDSIQATVAGFCSCYMTIGCPDDQGQFSIQSVSHLKPQLSWANVLLVGPGMGKGIVQQSLVAELYRQARQPMVIDADAINSLGESKINLGEHAGPRILTPHSGELVRLLGTTTSRAELEQTAVALAARHQLVFVLKGHLTLVTDGLLSFRNQTGNPGMATGGTGDVLTGIIGALLGQGLQPLEAARLAVHWHGLAGDLAAARFGQHSMIATDLIDSLGTAALSL